MKINKILIVTILFFSIVSSAQISKGIWMMGGSGSISNYKNTSNSLSQEGTNFNLFPNIGYFFIDKLATGASAQISLTTSSIGTVYGLTPFIRYYFLEKDKSINIFSEVSYGLQKQTNNNSAFQNFNVKTGTVFFLNNTVGVELTINYSKSKTNFNSQNRTISLGAGFQIHLEKR